MFLFEFKKIDKFSSHRCYNHKIELMFDKKFEWNFLYDMFKNELFVFEKYFQKNLNKKFIKFKKFDCSSFVLFVKKFEKNLRFCVDYRKLNAIVKKKSLFVVFNSKNFWSFMQNQIFHENRYYDRFQSFKNVFRKREIHHF